MANLTVDFDGIRRVDVRNDVVDHVVYKDRLNVTKVSHTDEILFGATRDSIVYSGLPVWKNLRRISPTSVVPPSPPPPIPTDPDFSSVVALLHFDGADSSTTFTDVKGHAFTANGNVQIDTAQSKFGGASGLFDGTGDYISTPSSADWGYGTGDFTWELWIRLATTAGNQYILDHGSNGGTLQYRSGGLSYYNTTIGFASPLYTTLPALTAGTWYHVAISRSGGTTRLFVDGVLKASGADSHNYGQQALRFGAYGGGGFALNGHLDEARITKGVARYAADFTTPDAPFPDA